jgi:hypothetical protein
MIPCTPCWPVLTRNGRAYNTVDAFLTHSPSQRSHDIIYWMQPSGSALRSLSHQAFETASQESRKTRALQQCRTSRSPRWTWSGCCQSSTEARHLRTLPCSSRHVCVRLCSRARVRSRDVARLVYDTRWASIFQGLAFRYTIKSLLQGVLYSVRLVPASVVGFGDPSPIVTVRTRGERASTTATAQQ